MSFRAVLAGLLIACATVLFYQRGLGADNADKSEQRAAVAPDLKFAGPTNRFGTMVFNGLLNARSSPALVMSPYSLGAALDLLALGAEGKTAALLSGRGGQPVPSGEDPAKLHRLLAGASSDDVILRLANSVWLRRDAEPLQAYISAAQGAFDAQVTTIDFAQQASADKINAWVKGATQGVIPGVIDELDPQTEFMLINTTYFKGKWAVPFDAAHTGPAPFTRADGSKHDVPMMNAALRMQYADGPLWHAVMIPYRGERFQMIVMTAKDPAKGSDAKGLDAKNLDAKSSGVRAELGSNEFTAAMEKSNWQNREVVLRLPRFRAEFGADLTPLLMRLGLSAAFGPNADYRKITKESLRATTVLQRALVEVTEEGTEAAAATTVTGTRSIGTHVAFSADRPFFFAITDTHTGAVLFIGHVADPAA
jgi:serine protease inhibitor